MLDSVVTAREGAAERRGWARRAFAAPRGGALRELALAGGPHRSAEDKAGGDE